jgi:hypothetical protein
VRYSLRSRGDFVLGLIPLLSPLLWACNDADPQESRAAEAVQPAEPLAAAGARFGVEHFRSNGFTQTSRGFEARDSALRAELRGDALVLRHGALDLGVTVRLVGAEDVQAELSGDVLSVAGGAPGGGSRFLVAKSGGVEDFVVAERPLPGGALRYTLALDGIRAVRSIAGALELLDAHGYPRLRVARPFVVDATGARGDASLEIEGCAVDVDPRAPFGRDFARVGADVCELVIRYDTTLAHPVLIDPEWLSTVTMSAPRTHHTAALLADGTVFVAGGFNADGSPVVATEILCPEADQCNGAPSFALGADLPNPRGHHTESYLASTNRVLLSGGKASRSSTAALPFLSVYDVATGTFEVGTPSMSVGRFAHTSTVLNDGRALIVGGEDGTSPSTAELYSPVTGLAAPAIPLANNKHRRFHVAESLGSANPRVLVAGGLGALGGEQSAEIFDPVANTFTALSGLGSQLSAVRIGATATLLEDGRVLVAGGKNAGGLYSQTIDIFQPNGAAGTFLQTSVAMTNARAFHGAIKLVGEGKVLLTGGVQASGAASNVLDFAEVFDQTIGDFIDPLATQMNKPRNFHTATRLLTGKALVIGGGADGPAADPGTGALLGGGATIPGAATAEVFARLNGESCDKDGECLSNNCYQEPNGICCTDSCTDVCSTCFLALQKNADGQGVCGIVLDDTPVREQCTSGVELLITCADGIVNVSQIDTCEPYVCADEEDCRSSCTTDEHCHPDYFCSANACVARLEIGADCTRDRQCDTDECVDGFCCSSACEGICQACNLPGFEGSCSQAVGDPVGDRGPCPGDVCVGTCGNDPLECDYDPTQVCSDATCADGVQSSGLCGAEGLCEDGQLECGDYTCDGEGALCRTTCETDEDCAGDAICRVNGECAVVEAAQCKADSTTVLINPDGSETDCAPFRCASAACITRCESIDDCAEGSVCDADGGCVAPPEDPPPVEDCSVGERGRSPRGFAGALALLALAAFTTRRGPGARTQRGVR